MSVTTNQVTWLGLSGLPFYNFPSGSKEPSTPSPEIPIVIKVFGIFTDPSGTPRSQSLITATTLEKIETGNVVIELGEKESTTTDENGYFELMLVPGKYKFSRDCINMYRITVPNCGPIDIQELI